jgi:hypothetical protein
LYVPKRTNDVGAVLGSTEVAGSFVSPKGLTRRLTGVAAGGQFGGVAGGMAAMAAASGPYDGAPQFGTVGYVAVTNDEIAVLRGKMGLLKPKVGDVVERVPRAEVASAELDGGALKAALFIRFANGGEWEFEVPKIHRKTAERVVDALNDGKEQS